MVNYRLDQHRAGTKEYKSWWLPEQKKMYLAPTQDQLVESFLSYYKAFQADLGISDDSKEQKKLRRHCFYLLLSSRELLLTLLVNKQIPLEQTKAISKAFRFFLNIKQVPNKIEPWFQKNKAIFDLLETATEWQEIHQSLKAGPFTVHNTIAAPQKQTETIIQGLLQINLTIPQLGLAKLPEILYGDVVLTDELLPKTPAFYILEKDSIYIQPVLDEDDLSSLVHELGHRYWTKYMSTSTKRSWTAYHDSLMDIPNFEEPKIGDSLPLKIRGYSDKEPVLKSKDETYYWVQIPDNPTKIPLEIPSTQRILQDVQKRKAYPTPYSFKDPEEHFCEALRLLSRGQLETKHLTVFQQILKKEETHENRSRYLCPNIQRGARNLARYNPPSFSLGTSRKQGRHLSAAPV